MRHSVFFLALLLAAAVRAQTSTAPGITNLAESFIQVWERNAGKSEAEFVKDFRASVEPGFPEFYGIERYAGKKTREQRDEDIARAFREFGQLREAYTNKAVTFASELPLHMATFQSTFPDYRPSHIYLIHGLGEMDGGTRTFNGKRYFIFGPDSMAKYHGKGSPAPFFHHELFHDYRPLKCDGDKIWRSLWAEGLATHVALTLNPEASNEQLLLSIPADLVPGVRAQQQLAWNDLESRLEDGPGPSYKALFQGMSSENGLPGRRGYYLGMLVAREVGRKYSLQQLADLTCDQVRSEVHAAVATLKNKPIE